MNLKRKSRSSEARKKLAGMRLAPAEAERSIRSVVENSLRDNFFSFRLFTKLVINDYNLLLI
jgi:hypothetical protein